jgi:hypothetical protein
MMKILYVEGSQLDADLTRRTLNKSAADACLRLFREKGSLLERI